MPARYLQPLRTFLPQPPPPLSRADPTALLRMLKSQFRNSTLWIWIRTSGLALSTAANGFRRYLKPLGRRSGVLFIGYAEGDLGLGQAFRANLVAAAQAGIAFAIYPFRRGIKNRMIGPFMPSRYDVSHAFDINVVEVAPDQVPTVFRTIDPRVTRASYNILCTFWELPEAPSTWREYLNRFDEIWVPNAFVANALRGVFSGPLTLIPPAIFAGDTPLPDRASYGMEPDRFYFMFSFDYFSHPHRKNPLAVVDAFRDAFPDATRNVGLIIKSIGCGDGFPEVRRRFLEVAEHDPRIVIIDRSLRRHDMLGLIRASDAYVSLHRSEGFGMGMAEAMSCGRIVIGTNYSGNTCFLTSETGFPVPYTLRRVRPWEYPGASGQSWAEPDVTAAADIMRFVVDNPAVAAARARAGQTLIRSDYGPAAVGAAMKRRIGEIRAASPPLRALGAL